MIIHNNTPGKIYEIVNKIKSLPFKRFKRLSSCRPEHNAKAGSHGVYYRRGKVGIKVLRNISYENNGIKGGYKTGEELEKSPIWHRAQAEWNNLVRMSKSGFTPIPYALKPVKVGELYYAAIFMQHIEGRYAPDGYYNELNKIVGEMNDTLNGYSHDHSIHNFIVDEKGKVFLIDLDPSYM